MYLLHFNTLCLRDEVINSVQSTTVCQFCRKLIYFTICWYMLHVLRQETLEANPRYPVINQLVLRIIKHLEYKYGSCSWIFFYSINNIQHKVLVTFYTSTYIRLIQPRTITHSLNMAVYVITGVSKGIGVRPKFTVWRTLLIYLIPV